jgi:hypothetical protein
MKPPWTVLRRFSLGWLETGTLISLVAIGSVVLLFAQLVDEVFEGESHAFDTAVLLGQPHKVAPYGSSAAFAQGRASRS